MDLILDIRVPQEVPLAGLQALRDPGLRAHPGRTEGTRPTDPGDLLRLREALHIPLHLEAVTHQDPILHIQAVLQGHQTTQGVHPTATPQGDTLILEDRQGHIHLVSLHFPSLSLNLVGFIF